MPRNRWSSRERLITLLIIFVLISFQTAGEIVIPYLTLQITSYLVSSMLIPSLPGTFPVGATACFIKPVLITFIILLWKVYWSHVISIFRKTVRIWIQSSLSYRENKTVVKRDPCGAPCANKALFWHNVDPLKQTLCAQLNRKPLIQTKRHRLTPRSFTLFSKMSLFIQLKQKWNLKNGSSARC